MDWLFWLVLAVLGWLALSLFIGFLVGRMFGAGTQSIFDSELSWGDECDYIVFEWPNPEQRERRAA